MKRKVFLYIGIILLISGIALKSLTDYTVLAWLTVISGALAKIIYLVGRIKSRSYKPGYEMIMLYLGLSLFFIGMYIKTSFIAEHRLLFIYIGIGFKILFVIIFAIKIKQLKR